MSREMVAPVLNLEVWDGSQEEVERDHLAGLLMCRWRTLETQHLTWKVGQYISDGKSDSNERPRSTMHQICQKRHGSFASGFKFADIKGMLTELTEISERV